MRVWREMLSGYFLPHRARFTVAMTREEFGAFADARGWCLDGSDLLEPRDAVAWAAKSVGWRRGEGLAVVVKVFAETPAEREQAHRTARGLRRLFVSLRRAGIAAGPRRR